MLKIAIATEDILSEEVAIKLISEEKNKFQAIMRFRKGGNGYLRKNIKKFCEISTTVVPILLITDLDNGICASALISRWMGVTQVPKGLLFRVAVREIESWLLADRQAMAQFLNVDMKRLPLFPDTLDDPKRTLLDCAKRAPREVRVDICAEDGAVSAQGLGYNQRLCDFVRNFWDPERAASCSDSLKRTRIRILEMADTIRLLS